MRVSAANFINLLFSLQVKKSCIHFISASVASQKVYTSGMSSAAAISQCKLASDGVLVIFRLS